MRISHTEWLILIFSQGGIQGTVESPLKGEFRLQSDHLVCFELPLPEIYYISKHIYFSWLAIPERLANGNPLAVSSAGSYRRPELTVINIAADQAKLQNRFQFIFEAMGQIGTDPTTLIDCSEVLPVPPPLPASSIPHFPAGKTNNDVEQAVSFDAALYYFSKLSTDRSP